MVIVVDCVSGLVGLVSPFLDSPIVQLKPVSLTYSGSRQSV
jgi:hypothetical protein